MDETIGFIGLGVLGSAMAKNLVKGGFTVIGFDNLAEKLTALEGDGGQSGAYYPIYNNRLINFLGHSWTGKWRRESPPQLELTD